MPYLLGFVIGLFVLAALFRIDFFFYILYLFFGIYMLSRLWTQRTIRNVTIERKHAQRAFRGEQLQVRVTIRNQGLLPVPWLQVHESIPFHLKTPNFYHCVMSLLPFESRDISYQVECRKRGLYKLGPVQFTSGDLFGIGGLGKRIQTDQPLMVYPRIFSLRELGLPAQSPFGDVPTTQRIFEDPTRMIGVRDYQSGDSLRHVHWKASASAGRLQVKRFEPAISIEALILLNLKRSDYTINRVASASELAIETVASIANHLTEKRQTVGLMSNGHDPLMSGADIIVLPPRKGRDQLMAILDNLARVELTEGASFDEVLRRARIHLTWGGTAIVVTADAPAEMFDRLLLLARAGFHVVLIVMDPQTPFLGIQQRAKQVGIQAYQIWQERDLDVWR